VDSRHDYVPNRRIDNIPSGDRCRRVRSHAARVGATVTVKRALVILAAWQQGNGLTVNEGQQRQLLTVQELLDHHLRAGLSENFANQALIDSVDRLFDCIGHDNTLAGGQTGSLDNQGGALFLDVPTGAFQGAEHLEIGRGDTCTACKLFAEAFGPLQFRGAARRAKGGNTLLLQAVNQAENQGYFWPYHHDVWTFGPGKTQQPIDILYLDPDTLRHTGDTGIAWSTPEFSAAGRLGNLPSQGVFPPTAPDQQDFQYPV
jgi:hypothetical protein